MPGPGRGRRRGDRRTPGAGRRHAGRGRAQGTSAQGTSGVHDPGGLRGGGNPAAQRRGQAAPHRPSGARDRQAARGQNRRERDGGVHRRRPARGVRDRRHRHRRRLLRRSRRQLAAGGDADLETACQPAHRSHRRARRLQRPHRGGPREAGRPGDPRRDRRHRGPGTQRDHHHHGPGGLVVRRAGDRRADRLFRRVRRPAVAGRADRARRADRAASGGHAHHRIRLDAGGRVLRRAGETAAHRQVRTHAGPGVERIPPAAVDRAAPAAVRAVGDHRRYRVPVHGAALARRPDRPARAHPPRCRRRPGRLGPARHRRRRHHRPGRLARPGTAGRGAPHGRPDHRRRRRHGGRPRGHVAQHPARPRLLAFRAVVAVLGNRRSRRPALGRRPGARRRPGASRSRPGRQRQHAVAVRARAPDHRRPRGLRVGVRAPALDRHDRAGAGLRRHLRFGARRGHATMGAPGVPARFRRGKLPVAGRFRSGSKRSVPGRWAGSRKASSAAGVPPTSG